jgi:hypothetical protein
MSNVGVCVDWPRDRSKSSARAKSQIPEKSSTPASRGAVTPRNHIRRLSTETKAASKTTEFFSYLAVLAVVLIAGAVVDSSDAGGYGARQVWLYATILTVGYMLSRGLAKSGSRDPYDVDENNG